MKGMPPPGRLVRACDSFRRAAQAANAFCPDSDDLAVVLHLGKQPAVAGRGPPGTTSGIRLLLSADHPPAPLEVRRALVTLDRAVVDHRHLAEFIFVEHAGGA